MSGIRAVQGLRNSHFISDELINNRSDLGTLEQALIGNYDVVNSIGFNGDAPVHVAAFMRRADQMKMLMEYGANVNLQERRNEDTAAHICARIGDAKTLKVLCENTTCDLNIMNKQREYPIDVAGTKFSAEADIDYLYMYSEWRGNEFIEEDIQIAASGRKECYDYLTNKMSTDMEAQLNATVNQVSELNAKMNKLAAITRGRSNTNERSFKSQVQLPQATPVVPKHPTRSLVDPINRVSAAGDTDFISGKPQKPADYDHPAPDHRLRPDKSYVQEERNRPAPVAAPKPSVMAHTIDSALLRDEPSVEERIIQKIVARDVADRLLQSGVLASTDESIK